MQSVALALLGQPDRCHGDDWRYGNNEGLSVDVGKGVFYDFTDETSGGVIDLIMRECGEGAEDAHKTLEEIRKGTFNAQPIPSVTTPGAARRANGHAPENAKPRRRFDESYDYCDENGRLLFQTLRLQYIDERGEPLLKNGKIQKTFGQRRPDGKTNWIYNTKGVRVVPYNLPQVLDTIENKSHILIVEGERKVNFLDGWDLTATCNAEGAGKWTAEHAAFLKDADVTILPDNDVAGRKHANIVGVSLRGKGRVLYFAGENPDDVRMRWLAMAEHLKFDVDAIDVHWIVGTKVSIANDIETIAHTIKQLGGVDLTIVDTGPAYFDGVDENSNTEMGEHARSFRALTTLPGGPCVLVLMHPVKHAKDDNLLPRGGGAFLAEIDGNIGVVNDAGIARMFHDRESCGKFRGAEFYPMLFELETVTAKKLINRKKSLMPTVLAKPISETQLQKIEDDTQAQGMAVLRTLAKHPEVSLREIANLNLWKTATGKPYQSKVERIVKGLAAEHLVRKILGRWQLSAKARKLLDEELKSSRN
jgi:hypothetical protein